jgi:sugar O-acyltransferase (sialic acid O-acetyltransferase NeuD family)
VAGRPLLIIGAGGFGRETAEAVHAVNRATPQWDLLGFLDDGLAGHDAVVNGLPVLGPVAGVDRYPLAQFVISIGNPGNFTVRAAIVKRVGLPPERYATIIHPQAVIPPSAAVGPGTVILATSVATSAVEIGSHVVVMPAVVFTHDDVVGDFATLGTGVRLAGGVTVGQGAYIGAGAMVRERLTIGPWALVGMGAGVTRDVPGGEVWAGLPARYLRDVARPQDAGVAG